MKFHLRVVSRAARLAAEPPRSDDTSAQTYRSYNVKQRLGPDKLQQLLDAYTNGESATSLAERFDISRQSVNVLAEEAGLPRRLKRLTLDQEKQIIQLYNSGLGQRRIANQLKLGKSTVQAVLARQARRTI